MAQHDYNIANQNGAAFRADLNSALAAIQSQNSGATEPAATVAYMPWADTNAGLWKIRSAANNVWVSVMSLTASRVDTAAGTSYDNSGSGLEATTVKDALDELDAAVTNVSGDYYSTTNILGTVSQSGGVPTGAIIERGSNANGEYVRFADGTMICSRVLASSNAGEVTWTFPSTFASAPNPSGTAISSDTDTISRSFRVANLGTGTLSFSMLLSSDARSTISVRHIAIGRWF